MTDPDVSNQSIEKLSIKLPLFWSAKPDIWFMQIEAQFSLSKITSDKTKYNLVITSLPHEVIATIYDVIIKPPQIDLYENLKKILISRLSCSEEKRLDDLLLTSELGDQKPSDFYRSMLATVGGTQMVSSELLLKLWQRKLPQTIAIALVASGKNDLDAILTIADKIWESMKSTHSHKLFEVSEGPSTSVPFSPINQFDLLKAFQDLNLSCQTLVKAFSEKILI